MKFWSLIGFMALTPMLWAQKSIVDENPVVEEFSAFDGSGVSATPTAGQLDSAEFAFTGFSDGDLAFGGTNTAGDYARGASGGGVTTGGIYAWNGGPDRWFFIQPGGSDFTPGTMTIRYVNNNPLNITSIDVSYQIMVNNDQARANSWNFSWSTDNITYTPVGGLDYTSVEAADVLGWVSVMRNTTVDVSGSPIAMGGFFYIRFESNDVSGSGSRDEIGVDKINVSATNLPVELQSFNVE